MRVLLSGGNKTENIVSGISKIMQNTGVDFVVIKFLDDINDMFSRGDYFDKAIITEQSITREGAITDEFEIRQRINNFSISMKNRDNKFSFVFLTQKDDLASVIYEEILQIVKESVVVLMKPPYYAKFFKRLIVSDINQLPEDWTYVPELDIPDEIEDTDDNLNDTFDDMGDMNDENEFKVEPTPDFETDLLGDSGIDENARISDEIQVDTGETLDIPDDDFGNGDFGNGDFGNGDFDNDDFGNSDFDTKYSETTEEISDFTDDMGGLHTDITNDTILDDSEPINQAGELPNYIENDIEENGSSSDITTDGFDTDINFGVDNGFSTDNNQDTDDNFDVDNNFGVDNSFSTENETDDTTDYSNSTLIGFDTDDNAEAETDEYITDSYDNDYDASNMGTDLYPNTFFDKGFGDDIGFDNKDYTDENDAEQDYQNDIANKVNAEIEEAGFNPNDYSDDTSNNINNNVAPQQRQTKVVQKQKKGLLGKLKDKALKQEKEEVQQVVQNEPPTEEKPIFSKNAGKVNAGSVKESLRPFASRGNSIAVTGCGGCGTSVIAYNLANIVAQLGYSVLLVDMDTEGRAQSYISKENYESMEPDGANLMAAVNSSNGINTHIAVVKQGFHLLTMGLGTEITAINEMLHKEKIARFINLCKTSHDFVIYDIPFNYATGYLSDITYMVDNLALVIDASNWGITKTMLSVCNIESEDMQDTIFGRAQIIFNKYRNLYKALGKKVKTCQDIKKVMDQKVLELIGEDPGLYFENLHIAGIINDDPDFETGWFESVQYSDTKKGQDIFLSLIENIVLKK